MKSVDLAKMLADAEGHTERLGLFAMLTLGIVESLASGTLSSADAIRLFYNAENCLFVRRQLHDRTAEKIMSHGVQLQDLFDSLPPREAQQEFQRELATMRSLCLQLLEQHEMAVEI